MSENELRKWQSKTIKTDETPSWNKESFLREPYSKDDFSLLADKNIEGGFVKPHNWIDQHDILNFTEFDELAFKEYFGNTTAQEMRDNGCGISSLYVALSTLANGFDNPSLTVGHLAGYAVAFHRNDLKDGNDNLIKKGTSVLSKSLDWYHDALVHVATTFDLGGHRCENLSLEQIASEMNYLNHEGRKVMIITSVSVNYRWPDSERVGGHLIVVNGFRTNSEGEVTEVCITDSSNFASRGNRENNWFQIDQHARDSFKGRAIFLYTK